MTIYQVLAGEVSGYGTGVAPKDQSCVPSMAVDEAPADLDTSPTSSQGQNDEMDFLDEDDFVVESGKLAMTADVSKPAASSMSGGDSADLLLDSSDDESDGEGVMGNKGVKRKATDDPPRIDSEVTNKSKPSSKRPAPRSVAAEHPHSLENLRYKQHRGIISLITKILDESGGILSQQHLRDVRNMLSVLDEKHKFATSRKIANPRKGPHPMTRENLWKRLEGEEEKRHPWAVPSQGRELERYEDKIPKMLFRVTDESSKGQIRDPRVGFVSADTDGFLNTAERRKIAIERHADFSNRHRTSFVSFSDSPSHIAKLSVPWLQFRQARKKTLDNTKLSIVSTQARIDNGLPILSMKNELAHYGARNACGDIYKTEWILPFRVGPSEIVNTWAWRRVDEWMLKNNSDFGGWVKKVGVPAYEEHERARKGGEPAVCAVGCKCCGH